jgi:hypothetical protein
MTEEQLARILAEHLDALLAGEPLPEEIPPELADLLPAAQNLTLAAPEPRPEFGPVLKQSLLGPPPGGNGPAWPIGGHIPLIIVAGLLLLGIMLALLGTAVVVGLSHLATRMETRSTPPVVESLPDLSQPAKNLASPSPVTPRATVTTTRTVDPELPQATATVVLDILPPITATLETTEEFILPPALAPGSPGSGGDNGSDGGNGRGDQSGDHNRGHGNDPDHHDEDNPGRSK